MRQAYRSLHTDIVRGARDSRTNSGDGEDARHRDVRPVAWIDRAGNSTPWPLTVAGVSRWSACPVDSGNLVDHYALAVMTGNVVPGEMVLVVRG